LQYPSLSSFPVPSAVLSAASLVHSAASPLLPAASSLPFPALLLLFFLISEEYQFVMSVAALIRLMSWPY
jgi:hypothetical protein